MANANIEESKKAIRLADHMLYVTYPIIKESRLLVKILEEVGKSVSFLTKGVLENESIQSKDLKGDFENFSRCAHTYGITESQTKALGIVLMTLEKHKVSPMEFPRKESFVIMSEEFQTDILNVDRLKEQISMVKEATKMAEYAISMRKI